MIRSPRSDRLTQGSVFCGGVADGFSNKPVWGIVITARCDTAHEKAPIINYLPLVRVEDWLFRDGRRLAMCKAISSVISEFKNLLTQRSLSHSLLEVYLPSTLAQTHFPYPADEKKTKKSEREAKQASQAEELAAQYEQLTLCLSDEISFDDPQQAETLRRYPRFVREIADSLIVQKLAGYYYLPDIGTFTEYKSSLGYVVNLREVRYIRSDTASRLLQGISKDVASEQEVDDLAFDVFDFACPVAETISPWTEHLLQAFCNLFGRIGVTDIDKSRAVSIAGAIALHSEVIV